MQGRARQAYRQQGNTLLGVLLGLLIGALIAVGVAVYVNLGPKPFVKKPDAQPAQPLQSAPFSQTGPIVLPGRPGEKPQSHQGDDARPLDKPQYDFYQTLPRGDAASVPVTPHPAPSAESEKVYLQAGSYQNPSEADNLKARLALMGIEANVQRVDLGDKGVFYRVRLGSFPSADAAETMRARLASEGIAARIVKMKANSQ